MSKEKFKFLRAGSIRNGQVKAAPLLLERFEVERAAPAKDWPTPRADNSRDRVESSKIENGRLIRPSGQDYSIPLQLLVLTLEKPPAKGRLSPRWIEQVMGFPTGWVTR